MLQRIGYAKTRSDAIAKMQGTYVPREKRVEKKKQEGQFIVSENNFKAAFYIYLFQVRNRFGYRLSICVHKGI